MRKLFAAVSYYPFTVCGESVAIFSNSFLVQVICVQSLYFLCQSCCRFINSIYLLKQPALYGSLCVCSSSVIFSFTDFCSSLFLLFPSGLFCSFSSSLRQEIRLLRPFLFFSVKIQGKFPYKPCFVFIFHFCLV